MSKEYEKFLDSKKLKSTTVGFEAQSVSEKLYAFQAEIVRWACKKGRAAIFADCGLGKTVMQLEWAREVVAHTGGDVLIVARLAVAPQTIKEASAILGLTITQCRSDADVKPGINICNYEMLHALDPSRFAGIVLDESSILKNFMGKTKQELIHAFSETQYRLCCTATPSPNDYTELGTHAEFLGYCSRTEMLSEYFCHDGGDK